MAVFLTGAGVLPVLGKKASDYDVGESVFLNVNGVKKEFLVVNQGIPSSLYDASCDGTWLLMKDVYENRVWDVTNHDYANSDIHAYLNNTFFGLFNADIKSIIKQVKIPYRAGTGGSTAVSSGANGLSTKIFLLSSVEVGLYSSGKPIDGEILNYFVNATESKRIGYLNGSAVAWWLRTPSTGMQTQAFSTHSTGVSGRINVTSAAGIRPCIILPSDTKFDPDTNEVIA